MDGWNTIVSSWVSAYFQGQTAVGFREGSPFLRGRIPWFAGMDTAEPGEASQRPFPERASNGFKSADAALAAWRGRRWNERFA